MKFVFLFFFLLASALAFPAYDTLQVNKSTNGVSRGFDVTTGMTVTFKSGSTVTAEAGANVTGFGSGSGSADGTVIFGSGVPSSGTGNNGDTYIRLDAPNTYFKSAGAWTLKTSYVFSTFTINGHALSANFNITAGDVDSDLTSLAAGITGLVKGAGNGGGFAAATAGTDYESPLTFTLPLSRSVNAVSLPAATSGQNGYLTSTDWSTFNNKQAGGVAITSLTGDATAAGPGATALTLATVNANVGSFTNANITVNAKGLVTAAASGSSSGSSANPSATIGLTAVNGSASTFMTSDSAPPLSQAIVPTWTGAHLWTPGSANTTPIKVTGYSVTGSSATPVIDIAGTWNTSNNATAIKLNITNTASGNPSYLLDLQVGGVSKFYADKSGNVQLVGTISQGTWGGTAIDVAHGGTGLASGTSGGVPYYSGSTTIASSGALTVNRLVLGGGAGAAPIVMGSLGTTTTLLHGNASGAGSFAAVSLTADVSGTLPVGNGGTGSASSPTTGQILVGNSGGTAYAPVSVSGDATMDNAGALTLATNAVTNAKAAQMAANTLKGNNTGSTANASDLTVANAATLLQGDGLTVANCGYRGLPPTTVSAARTLAAADNGTIWIHPASDTTARTFLIDSNANLALPVGYILVVYNDASAGTVTVSITSDTLVWLPTGSTGSRTLSANGMATLTKVTSTKWTISGPGVS